MTTQFGSINEKITLPYGSDHLTLRLEGRNATLIKPGQFLCELDQKILVEESFDNPLSSKTFITPDPSQSIAIGVNDQSRPLPNDILLPTLLKYLHKNNIPKENIIFFIATGTHLPVARDQFKLILPECIINDYKIYSHDCDDLSNLEFLGSTSKNTPVFINKNFYHSDYRILIGNVESHHFMGFSGGVKTAAIGLAGRETITENHSMLPHPNASMGLFSTNPMRQDVEEIGKLIHIDAALNVVINDNKEIVGCWFGNPYAVIEKAIAFYRENIQADLSEQIGKYDLVIASPGGYPKDINLYQAQKALTHACLFCNAGGQIILTAQCRDGVGSQGFFDYMSKRKDISDIINDFEQSEFVIGPHKAYQLARQMLKYRISLVSDLDQSTINNLHIKSYPFLQSAYEYAIKNIPEDAKIAILPYANHTMPRINEN